MDEDFDRINVIPLVDVMLVLLTIVLTTSTFIATGRIPLDLAEARHAGGGTGERVIVTMTLAGIVYVNDRRADDLASALIGMDRAAPVVVRADGGLALRDFIALADRVKGMGFQQVALEVRRS